ncbi:MAG: protein kinase [Gallionella sp.]|jgi:serine/threonine-protein kinase|nr:protein kinase [Gallionella sp.]MCK9353520.1 protein kinase [Gallionella sp.]
MEKPKKLGKYQIRSELGRGAMGVVYEAFDPLIERTVAIKTILKSSVDKSESEEAFSRFRREARAAGRLSHPKIVAIYEYGEDDDMAFIVMELIRGKELKEYFDREDSFSLDDGVRIVMQILDALDYSHAHGVVHRDIKPANILITRDGKIKIADFGIAKIDSSLLTQVGAVMGTPTYMPPEQFMGVEVDQRADIYSTGVILYQFLTGLRPFTGGVISVMHQVINQEPTPPSHINPNVPVQLDEVVMKAMAKKPEDRYQTVVEFMTALKLAGQTLPASREVGADKPGAVADSAYGLEGTVKLPEVARKNDIDAWQRITNSREPADFQRYLQDYPDGEFAELARRRIAALTEAAAQARLQQEARLRAEKEARIRKKAEQQAAAEKAQAEVRAQAEAEARRQQEAAEKERWARKIAEIKDEAGKAKAIETAKREQEATGQAQQVQAQRVQGLSASLSRHPHKFVEIVSQREAVVEAERRMLKENKRKLEEEVQRKQQAKMKLQSKKEAAETQISAAAEEKRQREAELEIRNKELEEAKLRIESTERRRKEAEERAALAHKRTRRMLVAAVGILFVLLLGGLILLFS